MSVGCPRVYRLNYLLLLQDPRSVTESGLMSKVFYSASDESDFLEAWLDVAKDKVRGRRILL